jgi:NAD(P)-dependent dehydrogenase (short-subunit alcohol dehydrogenase family)
MARFDFEGKRVLVTGAQRGIGYAVADAFGDCGADVTILAEASEVADAAARLSDKFGREVTGIQCDISDRTAVAREVGGLGHLDVLINNVGIGWPTPTLDRADEVEEGFRKIIDVNIMGTYYVTRSAVPNMERGGKIVNVSSVFGRQAGSGFSAYITSKHAVIGLTRALAVDLGPAGINVNAICPGTVGTENAISIGPTFLRAVIPELAGKEISDEEAEVIATSNNRIHEGYIKPEGIAHAFLFLASDAANDITGQSLNVDRGVHMA